MRTHFPHSDGVVQDCSNSIANALELLQSCIKPSIYIWILLAVVKTRSNWTVLHAVFEWLRKNVNQSLNRWRHQMETFSTLLAFYAGNHRSPVNSPHKGQWRRALMFSLICAWINSWANKGDAGHLRGYRAHYDVTVMTPGFPSLAPRASYVESIVKTLTMLWRHTHHRTRF